MTETPSKTVIYRAALPAHPRDWTLDKIRQFVADADAQGIPGDTPVQRFPSNNDFAFSSDNDYYGLGVERVVEAVSEDLHAEPERFYAEPDWITYAEPERFCDTSGCCRAPEEDADNLRIIIRYYDAQGQTQKFGAVLPDEVEGSEFCIDMREATSPCGTPPPCYGA